MIKFIPPTLTTKAPFSPIEMLDYTLGWFALDAEDSQTVISKYDVDYRSIMPNVIKEFPQMNVPGVIYFFPMILQKLVKDGYLLFDNSVKGFDASYSIALEGKLFSDSGGYKMEAIRNSIVENSAKANKTLLTLLTFFVSVGTMIAATYYLTELYWKYHWFH